MYHHVYTLRLCALVNTLRRYSLLCALLFLVSGALLPALHWASHGWEDHDHHGEGLHEVSHALDCDLCAHLNHISGALSAVVADVPSLETAPLEHAPVSPLFSLDLRGLQSPRAPPAQG
ncbi:MAG: hypothetical protein RhofKO_31380 [Rhodothermales bacterium]